MKPAPNKLFFSIGEASELAEVKSYVLRYWESEFDSLAPKKNETGQRVYRREDIEIILRIKDLLYNQGYTIAGARKRLNQELRGRINSASLLTPSVLRREFEEMLEIID
ncbi:TPA: MerR family transcriptional regulator [bacterium]|nr:MerR family transcriptional regulator [bacterium]